MLFPKIWYRIHKGPGASPNYFCTLNVIVTLRGGLGHDVKKKLKIKFITFATKTHGN